MKSDLNSVLIEGVVSKIDKGSFVIASFISVEDEFGDSGKIENRFEIDNPENYPIKMGSRVRVVGHLRYQNGDSITTIEPEMIEGGKK